MADPQAAALTQLRNIQAKTGQSIAALHAAIAASGLAKVGERRAWAMEHFGLGYGDANALALWMGKPLPDLGAPAGAAPAVASSSDPLDEIYAGAKAPLRALHEHITALVDTFGPHEKAPKKATVSLRRKKQFALLGPATKTHLEIGINHKALPTDPRLKVMPPGSMCPYTLRVASADEVDADVQRWLRAAYDAAG